MRINLDEKNAVNPREVLGADVVLVTSDPRKAEVAKKRLMDAGAKSVSVESAQSAQGWFPANIAEQIRGIGINVQGVRVTPQPMNEEAKEKPQEKPQPVKEKPQEKKTWTHRLRRWLKKGQ